MLYLIFKSIILFSLIYLPTHFILKKPKSNTVVAILGSGGHTGELLRLVEELKPVFIISSDDLLSQSKVPQYILIPRARKVHQKWSTTPATFIYSFVYSFYTTYTLNPKVIISNGPGVALPVILSGYLLSKLSILNCKILFIESICRVKDLSLTGKLVYRIADVFLVQWPELKEKYPKSEFHGQL